MEIYGQSAGMYFCTDSKNQNICIYMKAYENVWKYMVSQLECTFARIQIYQHMYMKTYENIWKCMDIYGHSAECTFAPIQIYQHMYMEMYGNIWSVGWNVLLQGFKYIKKYQNI